MKPFKAYDTELFLVKDKYQKGDAIAVLAYEVGSEEEFGVLSVNLPDQPPSPGCFWLKDWSENEPMAKAVLKGGLVKLTGRTAATGHVEAKEAMLVDGMYRVD